MTDSRRWQLGLALTGVLLLGVTLVAVTRRPTARDSPPRPLASVDWLPSAAPTPDPVPTSPPIVDVTPEPKKKVESDASPADLKPMLEAKDALKKKVASGKATDHDVAMLQGLCRVLRDPTCVQQP
jgi:hypothetical protein